MSYASMGANAIFNLLRRADVLMLAEGLTVFRVKVPPRARRQEYHRKRRPQRNRLQHRRPQDRHLARHQSGSEEHPHRRRRDHPDRRGRRSKPLLQDLLLNRSELIALALTPHHPNPGTRLNPMNPSGIQRRAFLANLTAGAATLAVSPTRHSRRRPGPPHPGPSATGGLAEPALRPLPLGAITPLGWLERQLRIQADGLSGHLDEFWPDVGPEPVVRRPSRRLGARALLARWRHSPRLAAR